MDPFVNRVCLHGKRGPGKCIVSPKAARSKAQGTPVPANRAAQLLGRIPGKVHLHFHGAWELG